MGSLTKAQQLAFVLEVTELLKLNEGALKSQGVDVSMRVNLLEREAAEAERNEAVKENLQAEAQRATETANVSLNTAYKNASSAIELIVGALGKDDKLVRRIKNIRDAMTNVALRGPKPTDE